MWSSAAPGTSTETYGPFKAKLVGVTTVEPVAIEADEEEVDPTTRRVKLVDPYLGTKGKPEDEVLFDEDSALVELLHEEVLFSNSHLIGKNTDGSDQETVVLYVNANDIFGWACAEAEDLPYEQVRRLYDLYTRSKFWGTVEWLCTQRHCRPQWAVERDMKAAGEWTPVMEALPQRLDEGAFLNPVFKDKKGQEMDRDTH